MLFKWVKIMITMEQFTVFCNTEGCDEAIDGFANSDPTALQRPIVSSCCDRDTCSGDIEDRECQQVTLCQTEPLFVTNSLQDFTKNQVRQTNCAAI